MYSPMNHDYRCEADGFTCECIAVMAAIGGLTDLQQLHLQQLDLRADAALAAGVLGSGLRLTHLAFVLCLLPPRFFEALATAGSGSLALLQHLCVSACQSVRADEVNEFALAQLQLQRQDSKDGLSSLRELIIVGFDSDLAPALPAVLDWLCSSSLQRVEIQASGPDAISACKDFNAAFASMKSCKLHGAQ